MRGFVRFLVLLLGGLAIAYLGAWWYVQGRLGVAFRAQEQTLRQAGWTISHGATAEGNSPLAATFTVADLTFTPPDQGLPTPKTTLPTLVLKIRPTAPFTLDVGLPLAWRVTTPQGPAFTVQFAAIHDRYNFDPNAVFDHAPDPLRAGMVAFTDMRVDSADTNFTLVSVKSFTADGTRNPQAGTSATAMTMHESLTGLALSPIFVTLGHLPFEGKLAALRLDLDLSGPPLPSLAQTTIAPHPVELVPNSLAGVAVWQQLGPAIHAWAKAGGHGSYAIALSFGPLDAHEHGQFGFDRAVQPTGKATLTAEGVGEFLGDVANAYPATVNFISNITAQTAPYMAKTPAGIERLTIDFGLANGVLTANGKKAIDVPPITWPAETSTAPSTAKP
ncbi:MAG: DUF2125 domain-containing protein [Acidiphilium sp.]|nr:DUF2125 domain-containing protein [Acidiphilium sp.]MDD4935732.1 DUF2125 domain-containing protein [Acidiphilium sp.]